MIELIGGSMSFIETTWKEGMSFEATVTGHSIIMDADEKFGGKNRGPRPKPLLLASLTGCTGMDVVSILEKMKIKPESFKIISRVEVAEEHPRVFKSIHLVYKFKGKKLDVEKLKKAVDLSQERYCPVSAMLRKACPLTYEIEILE